VQATKLARAIVREFGMSDALGPVGYGDNQQVFLGEELARGHEYSESTAEIIDGEVRRILSTALDATVERFTDLRAGLDAMAEQLVERESLTGQEALAAVRGALTPEQRALLRGRATVTDMPETVEDAIHEAPNRVGAA
jgi:cell division protease FtsH